MPSTDPHSYADLDQGRIEHIEFTFDVDFDARSIRGIAVYTIDRPVKDCFFLDLRDLTISGVHSPAGEVSWSIDREDRVLGQRLQLEDLGGQSEFAIYFETTPGASALQWLAPEHTAGGRHPYLFSQCQALHARSVFPCQDTPSVRFTYTADVIVPAPLTAVMSAERVDVCNGADLIESQSAEPAGSAAGRSQMNDCTVCVFDMPQAIPSYLFALAVGNLAAKDLGPRSRIYAEPEAIDEAAHEFAETERMIAEAEGLFGPYEWDRFDMLLMPPSFPYGGMENPRLTFLTPTLIVGDRSMVNVVVHELAHSWTGNLVTNATWEDFWLNEGWTVYAERRILEILDGEDYAQMKGALRRKSMLEDMKLFGIDSDPTRLNYSQKGIDPDEVFSTIPYEKGAAFIVSLEQAVGREVFDPFIKKYISTFRFQSLTTKGFVDFVKKELPAAADKVAIDEWLFEPGFPESAPSFSSSLLDAVDAAVDSFKGGALPPADEVAHWKPEQVELFLKNLPATIPIEHCGKLEEIFGLKRSRNNNLVVAFLSIAIPSGYEDALRSAERILSTVGRMLYLKPLYRALAETEWCKQKARDFYDRHGARYHPIAQGGIERILKDAGL